MKPQKVKNLRWAKNRHVGEVEWDHLFLTTQALSHARSEERGIEMQAPGNVTERRAQIVFKILREYYPHAGVALEFENPLEILVATILSAQCTDARVNMVTKLLFKKYMTVEDYANADRGELETDIRSTGFYHNKARYIQAASRMIIEEFGGTVPRRMEDLLRLPGVARKTANIVLSNGFGVVEGIAVDTHVKRTSKRLGLTENTDPDKIEKDLMKVVAREEWFPANYLLIELGRDVCVAGIPYCDKCPLNKICPSAFKLGERKPREIGSKGRSHQC
jgi:endonuclease-3